MGGLAFLMKKGWHPNSNENKKAVFIAEKEAELRAKREEEAASEVRKERALQAIEETGDISARDPREAALKFMYALPSKPKNCEEEDDDLSGSLSAPPTTRSTSVFSPDEEDPDVVLFRQKVARKQGLHVDDMHCVSTGRTSSSSVDAVDQRDIAEEKELQTIRKERERLKQQPGFGQSSQFSTLEAVVGRKRRLGLTQDEQAERHPTLKHAPVEGEYARGVEVRHKPFAQVIRNVQCFRCGEWGHAAGDRECPQASFNPHDQERREREDPLTFMRRHSRPPQSQSQSVVTLKQAALPAELRLQMSSASEQSVTAISNSQRALTPHAGELGAEGVGDQDAEAVYLASLSSKDKVKLLHRLEVIETAGSSRSRDLSSRKLAQRLEKGGLRGLVEASSSNDSDSSDSDGKKGRSKHRHHKHKEKRKDKRRREDEKSTSNQSKKKKKKKHKH